MSFFENKQISFSSSPNVRIHVKEEGSQSKSGYCFYVQSELQRQTPITTCGGAKASLSVLERFIRRPLQH